VAGWLSRWRLLLGVVLTVVVGFVLDGWDVADRAVQPGLVDQATQLQVASSRSLTSRNGLSRGSLSSGAIFVVSRVAEWSEAGAVEFSFDVEAVAAVDVDVLVQGG